MSTTELADTFERLANAATAGPWEVDTTKALGTYGVWTAYVTHPDHDGAGYPSQICQMPVVEMDRKERDANAALFAFARNNAPAIVAALRDADRLSQDAGVPAVVQRIEAAIATGEPIGVNAQSWLDYCCRKIRGLRRQVKQRDRTIAKWSSERQREVDSVASVAVGVAIDGDVRITALEQQLAEARAEVGRLKDKYDPNWNKCEHDAR